MIAEQGTCTVTCEFCQKPYKFDAIDVEQLFDDGAAGQRLHQLSAGAKRGSPMFRKRYVAFLNELSKLAKTHDELTDTDVRERLHEVINYHFVWGKPMKGFPKRFAMMSTAADRKVAAVVKKFVVDCAPHRGRREHQGRSSASCVARGFRRENPARRVVRCISGLD